MKYYLIAGEASGDMHGANLMLAIKQQDTTAEFRFWGGDKMAQIPNATQVEHYKNTAFMGFVEVLKHLRTIFKFIKQCKEDIQNYQPDVVIFIDYPGFNLRIAKFVKEIGIKTVYYISPQVWAWKENRVKKIKQYIDKMLVILPFEKDFYKKWNYNVVYVGHPLLDEISDRKYPLNIQKEKPIIALLPGSRKQEIEKILPEFLSVVNQFKAYQFVVAGLSHIEDEVYTNLIGNKNVIVVKNNTYGILQQSHAAIVASGTATLETALFGVPLFVGYKGNFLSYYIGRMLVKIKFISLVNLIFNEQVVTELIQNDLNKENIEKELKNILSNPKREQMIAKFQLLRQKLGNKGASTVAATEILSLINSK
ncbi:MAG: lipid-A-disaccharide synthase [Chitinophagales bacterium]|nr:lipid-A-disaccharide synthase [Chitinophagales bacterium]